MIGRLGFADTSGSSEKERIPGERTPTSNEASDGRFFV